MTFKEGDAVHVNNLDPAVLKYISSALGCPADEIEFYFVEYEGDKAVLSAECEKKYAIVHCSASALVEGHKDDAFQAELLIDHMIREGLLDRALETRDEALFRAVLEYRENTPVPEREHYETELEEFEEYDDDNLTRNEANAISDYAEEQANMQMIGFTVYDEGYPDDDDYDPYDYWADADDYGAYDMIPVAPISDDDWETILDVCKEMLDSQVKQAKKEIKEELKEELKEENGEG